MSHSHVVRSGRLRLDEVDATLVLPQILRLRATVGRRVSIAPDVTPWRDPRDGRAMHWGVFREAELVAAARLCVHASADDVPDAAPLAQLGADVEFPIASMSLCVVHPRARGLRLEAALDAVRIERARQLGLGAVVAVARSARRLAALAAQGFAAVPGSAPLDRSAVMLRLAPEQRIKRVSLRVPSRM